MIVDVDKITEDFLRKVTDLYNQEVYFIATCYKFSSKYSLESEIRDDHLRIYFEENNNLVWCGQTIKYCDKDSKKAIKITDISDEVESPDIVINNYIKEDKWSQIDW